MEKLFNQNIKMDEKMINAELNMLEEQFQVNQNSQGYNSSIFKLVFQQKITIEKGKSLFKDLTDAEKEKKELEREIEEKKEKIRTKEENFKRIKNAGLEFLFEKCTLENFQISNKQQQNVLDMAKEYLINHNNNWLFIGGNVGSGKTHICSGLLAKFIEQGVNCKFMQWKDDGGQLKNVINSVEYNDKMAIFKTVDILYIDDFLKTKQSKEKSSIGDINLAFDILNYRYNKNLKTIISSEKTIEQITDGEDEAVGSRIYEKSKGFCLTVTNIENYRLK